MQELAQKEGRGLPAYCTNRSGEAHVPLFVSTVEIEGEIFTGQAAKTKKQAEMSAAKVAYIALKQRTYLQTYLCMFYLVSFVCHALGIHIRKRFVNFMEKIYMIFMINFTGIIHYFVLKFSALSLLEVSSLHNLGDSSLRT